MLRLTDVKLPLDHPESAIRAAILVKLGISPEDLRSYDIVKRSYDARKRSAILLIYSIDVEVRKEADILQRLHGDPHVKAAPDTSYHFVTQAPPDLASRW